jgi:hypothetical protein
VHLHAWLLLYVWLFCIFAAVLCQGKAVPKTWVKDKQITLPSNLLFRAFPGQLLRPMQLMFSVHRSGQRIGGCAQLSVHLMRLLKAVGMRWVLAESAFTMNMHCFFNT